MFVSSWLSFYSLRLSRNFFISSILSDLLHGIFIIFHHYLFCIIDFAVMSPLSLLILIICLFSLCFPHRSWLFYLCIYLFLKSYSFFFLIICFWLCWVFFSVRGLSLVAASGGQSSSRCAGLSLSWPLLLRSTGSRRAGSVVVAHGPSCSTACGIFPDQGLNPCPLH